MTKSKGWDWNVVKGGRADFWREPSRESFYLLQRWSNLGLTRLLDLGCGLGRHSILFGQNEFNVSCFDISEEAINQTKSWAEEENLQFDYQVGDMLELPYPDDSFDAIICYHVINHTDTAGFKRILSEIRRVLRPGGECYFTLGSKETWGWKSTDWPLVDENTKLRKEPGPEYDVPHFYADYDLIKNLCSNFSNVNIQQLEEFVTNPDDPTDPSVRESWHYHVLVRK